jgi:hypothetical protein
VHLFTMTFSSPRMDCSVSKVQRSIPNDAINLGIMKIIKIYEHNVNQCHEDGSKLNSKKVDYIKYISDNW